MTQLVATSKPVFKKLVIALLILIYVTDNCRTTVETLLDNNRQMTAKISEVVDAIVKISDKLNLLKLRKEEQTAAHP